MRFVAKLLLTTVVILGVVAATNYVVDPYGVFLRQLDEELVGNRLFGTNVRLAKAHVVSRLEPQAVILGSSRAELGLSPQHSGWQYERVYNLGLPHASIREVSEYFEHALASGSLRQVVLALDFFQFNPVLDPQADFDECRLRDAGSVRSRIRARWCDIPVLLLSRHAFVESMQQLFGKEQPEGAYFKDGSRPASLGRMRTQHEAFVESERNYFERRDLLRGFLESELSFEEVTARHFEDILRQAHEHDIDLRILISPSHARQWEVIRALGLWPDFVKWKRYLLDTTVAIADELGAEPYPVWDFADYSDYSREPVPQPGDEKSRMTWYIESSHYTRALGALVLDNVLADKKMPLGRRLDLRDFDEWILSIDARGRIYRRAAADELTDMREYLVRR